MGVKLSNRIIRIAWLRNRELRWEVDILCEAIHISKLEICVKYLAADFASKALISQAPTQRKIHRIQRALYRFEIYCSMFPDDKGGDISDSIYNVIRSKYVYDWFRNFFRNFSLWGNEQLACVHDYLAGLVIPGML